MYTHFEKRLKDILDQPSPLLSGGLKGIEKESLRVTRDGRIAQSPHSAALGSALTHPHITTDYSEALLELITPPFADTGAVTGFLSQLHQFTYTNIGDELLWPASMPCMLKGDESIPIARYGRSNIGTMKHVYRLGLAYRYGRAMQAISGVHFNYSLPEGFWPMFQDLERNNDDLQGFIADAYFRLIRNVQRFGWLLPYLFGSSPAICKSFLNLRGKDFDVFDGGTYYQPYATCLRMSDIGYKNSNQAGLKISYNTIDEYVESLSTAVNTPHPPYAKIGVNIDGKYRQLNANILQIENEYYSFVRPKQIARSGEKPVIALKQRGVKYVEIRALDVSPFDPLGVDETTLYFLETFAIFCLLCDSPPLTAQEQEELNHNQTLVALRGREPGLKLLRNGQDYALKDWAKEIFSLMQGIGEQLDNPSLEAPYCNALTLQQEKIDNPESLPSQRILDAMKESGHSFFRFALSQAEGHEKALKALPEDRKFDRTFTDLARQSLGDQRAIEEADAISFTAYLDRYFSQE